MSETFIHLNETHSTNSYLRELIMREKEQSPITKLPDVDKRAIVGSLNGVKI